MPSLSSSSLFHPLPLPPVSAYSVEPDVVLRYFLCHPSSFCYVSSSDLSPPLQLSFTPIVSVSLSLAKIFHAHSLSSLSSRDGSGMTLPSMPGAVSMLTRRDHGWQLPFHDVVSHSMHVSPPSPTTLPATSFILQAHALAPPTTNRIYLAYRRQRHVPRTGCLVSHNRRRMHVPRTRCLHYSPR